MHGISAQKIILMSYLVTVLGECCIQLAMIDNE